MYMLPETCIGMYMLQRGFECIHIYIHIYSQLYTLQRGIEYIHVYSQLQIGWHRILRLFLEKFNLVPGVPGFSWELPLVPFVRRY